MSKVAARIDNVADELFELFDFCIGGRDGSAHQHSFTEHSIREDLVKHETKVGGPSMGDNSATWLALEGGRLVYLESLPLSCDPRAGSFGS